jgi:superfamily I DNA/RNA helicase
MGWLVPFVQLTDAQRRAVQLSPERHRIFSGPPGSGKSMVLLHRAAFLRDRFRIPEKSMAVFVYTKALRRYLRQEAPLLGLDPQTVNTFDSWCWHKAREIRVREAFRKDPDFSTIREKLARFFEAEKRVLFDAVLVDEGQDLDEPAYRILRTVARHVTVCTDPNQRIYDRGSSDGEIARWLGLDPSRVAFLDAFRCSPLVSQLASLYLASPESREQFLRQVRQGQGEREVPVLFVASSQGEERERVVSVAKTRLARGERVGILVPSKSFFRPLEQEAARQGLGIAAWEEAEGEGPGVVVLTYHAAKGLVFDSVLLPGIWPGALRHGDEGAWERLLFVGITRARRWVFLATQASPGSQLFAPLVRLSKSPVVEIQRGACERPPAPSPSSSPDDLRGLV